jgi:hypothetical protein
MNQPNDTHEPSPPAHDWAGLKELDKALAEGRLTEYRIKKAWADPLVRLFGLGVGAMFAGYICFVIYWDLIRQ